MARIGLLGTGIMGAGMARSIIRAGHDLTVWNRSQEKAAPLADDGATVVGDPAEAVRGAEIVVTMLYDADSVADVVGTVAGEFSDGAVWLQTSTVGLDGVDRLGRLAREHGIAMLDAPVLGTKEPAEKGALTVLVGGDESLRERVEPVLDAIGAGTVWVGPELGDGHRLKLVANSWVLSLVTATGQAIGLAQRFGVDPQLFLDAISGGPLDAGYAQLKGKAMLAREFPASFGADGALKDAGLIAAAMESVGMDASVMQAIHDRFVSTVDAGHAREDMASVIDGFDGR
ncbi:NAD(P)-dependent oxidoreductase [Williamsia serinedens]|uniref:3-hydroxyisobutyrate dehydrogenase n=1 Tax=Williamsia serinedens TaxID=391736 RepID=A0ABT1GZU0_9NOCA|nr:NAD(P)-dependent oxidoreductase [Williamsia serinedens]MCP2160466.1 3-hydroxyisobutyrate dehydrogenase [Williamsia serinedens]